MSCPCPLSPLRPSEAATPAEAVWISVLCHAVVPKLGDSLAAAVRAVVRYHSTFNPDALERSLNTFAEAAAAAAAGRCAAEYWWVGRDLVSWEPLLPEHVVARVELPAVSTKYDRERRRWVLVPTATTHRYNIYLRIKYIGRPRPVVGLLPIDVNTATIALAVFPTAPPPADLLEEVRARVAAAALEGALEEAGA